MNNLKRVLSLGLASTMLMGMMVVGAGAADKMGDFPDADKVTYTEAVDVMVGSGIIAGNSEGKIDPQGTLTREMAAKIVAYAKLGATVADAMKTSTDPFTDVAANRWSAGYIAYCVQEGILSGRGNGIFDPEAAVTGNEMAKMLLCAVGYGVNGEYTGGSWAMSAAKDGLSVGIFTGNTAGASLTAATREEAMLYTFNAMTKVTPVNYSSVLGSYYDTKTLMGDDKNDTLATSFGLKKVDATDANGLAGHKWAMGDNDAFSGFYNSTKVIATLNDTSSKTFGDIYKLGTFADSVKIVVNGTTEDPSFDAKANITKGSSVKLSTMDLGYKGAKVEFCDALDKEGKSGTDGKIDTITVTISYLAKVTGVTKATSTADRKITFEVYDAAGNKVSKSVETEKFEKDQYILVTPNANSTDGFAEPVAMDEVTTADGTISTYKSGSVTVGGTAYGYNTAYSNANYKGPNVDSSAFDFNSTYTLYLDAYGNIIGMAVKEAADSALAFGYVSQRKVVAAGDDLVSGTTDATVRLKITYMDGTTEVVDYAIKTATGNISKKASGSNPINKGDAYVVFDGENWKVDSKLETAIAEGLYSYTLSSDGEITLSKTVSKKDVTATKLASGKEISVKKNQTNIGTEFSGKYVNSATSLVTVNGSSVNTITGYKNFPSNESKFGKNGETAVIVVTNKNTVTNILVIGADVKADTSYVYGVYAGLVGNVQDGTEYNFFVDGEVKKVLDTDNQVTVPGANDKKVVYRLELDENDKVVSAVKAGESEVTDSIVSGKVEVADTSFLVVDGKTVNLADGAKVYNLTTSDAAGDWGTDSVDVGDTVTYCIQSIGGNAQAIVVFITAEA